MSAAENKFFSGTSGLVLPFPKSKYPEEFRDKSRLCFFSNLFNSIEINSSFYSLPKQKTIQRWTNEVNDDFRFTFKLSKTITHCKGLAFNSADVELFFEAISPAVQKKGCLLVQFPPGLKIDHIEQFGILMEVIKDANLPYKWPVAIEFRNDTWNHSEVNHLLGDYNITRVIHDLPGSATERANNKSCCRYLRFHGPEGNYRGSYHKEVLLSYAERVKKWMSAGQMVFVYFNNTAGDALNNLQTFNGLIGA